MHYSTHRSISDARLSYVNHVKCTCDKSGLYLSQFPLSHRFLLKRCTKRGIVDSRYIPTQYLYNEWKSVWFFADCNPDKHGIGQKIFDKISLVLFISVYSTCLRRRTK